MKPTQPLTSKDSLDDCIQCGLLIPSQRQIEQPGCCFCAQCVEELPSQNTEPKQ